MQSLRRERLASALHLETGPGKTKSQDLDWKRSGCMDKNRDLKGFARKPMAKLGSDPRETVPTSGSSSKYPQTN
jgi:hypothetical protein